METKCMGKDQPPAVLHMIGLSNCRGEMQIFEGSTLKGSCPNSVCSFQLLKMWSQCSIPGGQMLIFSCRAPTHFPRAVCRRLWSAKHTNCYHKFFLRGIFTLLCKRSCADSSFTNVKKEQQFQTEKLPLPSLGMFQSLSLTCFVECLRFIPSWWHQWLAALPFLYIQHITPHSSGERGCETLGQEASISLCTAFCILTVSYSRFFHGSSSRHQVSSDYLHSVK